MWLGNYNAAEHVPASTSLVINCTNHIPFFSDHSTNIRIPVEDNEDPKQQSIIVKYWTDELMDTILNHILQSRDVLIHCQMGRQRSAATVAAFFMTTGMSKEDSIHKIRLKHKEAFFPDINFDEALDKYSEKINNFD